MANENFLRDLLISISPQNVAQGAGDVYNWLAEQMSKPSQALGTQFGAASVAPPQDIRSAGMQQRMPGSGPGEQDIMQPRTRELVMNEALLKAAKAKISKGAKGTVEGMTMDQAAEIEAQGENMMNQKQGAGQTGTAQPSPTGTAQPTTQQPTQGADILKQLMGGASGGLKGALGGFAEGFAWGVNPEMMKSKASLKEELNKADKEGMLKPEHLLSSFEKLAKPWRDVQGSFGRLQSAMTNPQTNKLDFSGFNPAGDLDLLFGTAKTLDPGGRVTDSDVAIQTLMTGKYGDNIAKIAQKFKRKGSLAPGEREALYKAAKTRFSSDKKIMEGSIKELERKAVLNNIDPRRIISYEGFDSGISNIEQQDNRIKEAMSEAKKRGLL
jgi:hypothetical protein